MKEINLVSTTPGWTLKSRHFFHRIVNWADEILFKAMRFAQDMCEQWPYFFGSWLWHSPHHDPSGRGGNVANVDHDPTNIFVPMTPKHKVRRHIDPEHLDFFMGHDGSFIAFCKFVCFVQHPFPSNPPSLPWTAQPMDELQDQGPGNKGAGNPHQLVVSRLFQAYLLKMLRIANH